MFRFFFFFCVVIPSLGRVAPCFDSHTLALISCSIQLVPLRDSFAFPPPLKLRHFPPLISDFSIDVPSHDLLFGSTLVCPSLDSHSIAFFSRLIRFFGGSQQFFSPPLPEPSFFFSEGHTLSIVPRHSPFPPRTSGPPSK